MVATIQNKQASKNIATATQVTQSRTQVDYNNLVSLIFAWCKPVISDLKALNKFFSDTDNISDIAWQQAGNLSTYLPICLTIYILPLKVLLAPSGPLRGESAILLVFSHFDDRCLLQLDHVSGTTYLLVCETRKSAAQNSEDNWKHSCFRRTAAHRDFFHYCALYSYYLPIYLHRSNLKHVQCISTWIIDVSSAIAERLRVMLHVGVEFYFYPTVSTALIHLVKPGLTRLD